MKWANAFMLFVNVVLAGMMLYYISTRGLLTAPTGWDYKDLITILLTAIAVILAGVTIFVAVVAIYGYNAIRDAAKEAAGLAARDIASDVARTVASRETPEAVKLFLQVAGEHPVAAESVDRLAAEMKAGEEDRDGHRK